MTELEQRLTNELGKLAEQVERLEEQVTGKRYNWPGNTHGGELYDSTRRGPAKDGRTHHEIDRRLRKTDQHMQRVYERLQRARGGFKRTVSLIHGEAEQKRKEGDRWDRVEGRIESLIQGRVRSRSQDFSR